MKSFNINLNRKLSGRKRKRQLKSKSHSGSVLPHNAEPPTKKRKLSDNEE